MDMTCKQWIFLAFSCLLGVSAFAQTPTDSLPPVFDYSTPPQEYEIGGIKVEGARYSDANALKTVAGLRVGEKIRIPGPETAKAIKNLWKLKLFTDVQIIEERRAGNVVFLLIRVQERPRLTSHSFKGAKKTDHDDLNLEVNKFLVKGGIVTENVKRSAAKAITDYYVGKGFLDAQVEVEEIPDSKHINAVKLVFKVDRGKRVRIKDILFVGNQAVSDGKLRRKMHNTKRKRRPFAGSKYIEEQFEEDKESIIAYYNTIGYRDARILGDSLWRDEKGNLLLLVQLEEGYPYYFRNISFKGNSIYDDKLLRNILGIKKGDVYNQELLNTRLTYSQDGRDISTLYMDNGYLFFRIDPVETAIVGDSIDLELRIFEGPLATIDKVLIHGNDRTHEHVIRRELRTIPGNKFSRTDIIRSQREIVNLGYFNPETLGINTPVNPERGTVDIEYTVEEKPSDQLELSAGWGGVGRGVIGTLGVSFNNFSVRNLFDKDSWAPLPQGDGQRLSVRAQTNGRFYQSYNISFTEPWLGGKKPNSFSVATFHTRLTNGLDKEDTGFGNFSVTGGTISLGTRLKVPDDNFISSTAINYQGIALNNWTSGLFRTDEGVIVSEGFFNNFSITQTISRSSIDNPLFPQQGSVFSLSVQFTPPYSLFSSKDYPDLPVQERYRWLEYHKWRFKAEWYTAIVGKLTLKVGAKVGMLGSYSKKTGISPFERFQLGGDGLNNLQFGQFNGTDIVSMRGYEIEDLEANFVNGQTVATPVYDKFTVELRYPLSLNPNSTIYVLAFAEGANTWQRYSEFNPFELKRSAGLGLRVFLPMFGLLGFDYAIGFDKYIPPDSQKSFFQNYGNFNIILGFEPE